MAPMMRSRARWNEQDGEPMPAGPPWQHSAARLLYVADEHAPTHTRRSMTMDRVVANVRSLLPEDLREAWSRLNGGGKGGSEGDDHGGGKGQGSNAEQA
eukprot:4661339-Lingulodinium_polyedra.AAC.1